MKLILQSESSECGLACLAIIASHYGYHVDLTDLRRKFAVSLKGATLGQLMRHASVMRFSSRPLRIELPDLKRLQLPCILHWDSNHFVVFKGVKKNFAGEDMVILLDPAVGERLVSMSNVSEHFTGVVLELTPMLGFEPKNDRRRISISDLTGRIHGLRGAISQAIALALSLEVFVLAAPLFNQFVIDEVVVSGDRELLSVMFVGFAMLVIVQTLIGLARSWFLMRWSLEINYQWGAKLFAHLLSLPVSFFEKRHLGDVVSRFGSISVIQNTLTSLFVESFLDGVMAALALGMMLLYSPKLTVVVLVAVLAYICLRWLSYKPFRDAAKERMVLSAKESSHFMESVRAISPLKLFGREDERRARWLNLKADVQNRDVKTQKLEILFKMTNTFLSAGQGLMVFYLGALQVMQGPFTIGMLLAFTSYSTTFTSRIFSLVDLFVNVRVLNLHCERLADIVLEEPEIELDSHRDLTHLAPTITLKNIKFRYAEGEPFILNGVDLTIPAGQSVALVGPSGCGKTTLCKIIIGLLQPTEGEVCFGGVPIRNLGIREYRKLVGTVMQDDVLLAGSIADNINFFDACLDMERVKSCAKKAALHSEIAAMPMGYQTLVGDMGSSLSGGQKQRVLLARALYKQPLVLALDEATSHLDLDNEYKVNLALRDLNLTKIMIAHRPETIKAAERVLLLKEGVVCEHHFNPISNNQFNVEESAGDLGREDIGFRALT